MAKEKRVQWCRDLALLNKRKRNANKVYHGSAFKKQKFCTTAKQSNQNVHVCPPLQATASNNNKMHRRGYRR